METLESSRSIQEFWIDFLLEEEFRSDPDFARSFVSACGLELAGSLPVEVTHSFSDEYGEADLVVEFPVGDAAGSRSALLIENKITAGFQPQQAQRYQSRGLAGLAAGRWQAYRTVLVAPEKYIKPDHGFDAAISLEQLSAWVCTSEPRRREFKLERIGRAIEKKNLTGVQIVDEVMTEFRRWYGSMIDAREAGFIPPAPRPAYRDDNWMEWTSTRLPGGCKFRHRTRTGVVDLSIEKIGQEQLVPLGPFLPAGAELCTIGTGRPRGAIQLRVTPIVDFSDLPNAGSIVRTALDAAEQMQQALLANKDVLKATLSTN